MRILATMLATVAAVCVIEILLLFSIAVPARYDSFAPNSHQVVAIVVSLLLIPAIAAFFSRLYYGKENWVRRAVTIFVVPVIGVCGLIAILVGEFSLLDALPYGQQEPITLAMFVADVLVATCVAYGLAKMSGRRSVELEKQRWLAERHSSLSRSELFRQRRMLRWALWLPTATVLLALVFLPETWALASHAVHPGERRVAGCRFAIPASWVVLASKRDQLLMGVIGRGIARGARPWAESVVPISFWSFHVADVSSPASDRLKGRVLEMRSFFSGDQSITCARFWPRWLDKEDSRYSSVECSGSHGFAAHFEGESRYVPAFYGVISRIERLR